MQYRVIPALLAGALLVLAGCEKSVMDAASPTAPSPEAGFDSFVTAIARKPVASLSPQELDQAIDQFVSMQVAAEAAVKQGLDKDPEVQTEINLARMNVLSEALLTRFVETNPVTDAEIQAEYDEQVKNAPMEYRARHILVEDKAVADNAIQKLDGGADFAKLAKELSKDPGSAANGGDLNWFSPQTMVPPFAAAVVSLEKGAYTKAPVQTQFGWHVIKLEDKREPSIPALEGVKDRVQQIVQRKKLQSHLESLRKTTGVEIEKQTAAIRANATAQAPLPVPQTDSDEGADAGIDDGADDGSGVPGED